MSGVTQPPCAIIKRGETLALTVTVNNPQTGQAQDLTAAQMTCQVRDPEGNLVATLTPVAVPETVGEATIRVLDTSAWPEMLLALDVEVVIPGVIQFFSPTYGVRVDHAITQTVPAPARYNPVTGGGAQAGGGDYGWPGGEDPG